MTHTCTKVTVRQRAIRNNRISLYLDYYPAARSAEREALEPMLSRNIIKLQITDNHILSKAQSKSKSF